MDNYKYTIGNSMAQENIYKIAYNDYFKKTYKTAIESNVNYITPIKGFPIVNIEIEEEPSSYLLEMITKTEEQRKKGEVSPIFDNAESAIKWLNS